MKAISSLAVRYPVTVVMIFTGVILLGYISLDKLGIELLPDISSPKVVVVLESGNRPPREMEDVFGERLESQLSTISGVSRVSSVSRVGSIMVTVEFYWDNDMDFALLEVQKNIGYLQADREVDSLSIRRFDPQAAPVLRVGMFPAGEEAGGGGQGADLDELRRLAEDYVRPALERLRGVAAVRISGGREREVIVETDEFLLDAFGITVDDVAARVSEANVDTSGGTLEEDGKIYVIKGVGRFTDLDQLRMLTVAYLDRSKAPSDLVSGDTAFDPLKVPVPLSRVARVYYGDKEVRNLVRINGIEGVGLSVHKEGSSNTVKVSDDVRGTLDQLSRSLPGVSFEVVRDQARFITGSIREVEEQALIGALLAIFILYLFLRSFGATLVIALAIPLSIIATFVLMYFAGLSLNIMTLGGLALGVGLLVDNAIVVIENIFRHLQAGKGKIEAAIDGAAEVGGAIFASTLTTCVVFLPVVFIGDITGELLKEQAFTVSISLLCSLVVAMVLIPMLASRMLKQKRVDAVETTAEHVVRSKSYYGLLDWALSHKLVVVVITLILGLFAAEAFRRSGTEFLPRADQGEFGIRMVLPEGTPVERTAAVSGFVEDLLLENFGEEITAVYSDIGKRRLEDELLTEEVWDENTALVLVSLKPFAERDLHTSDIINSIDPVLRDVPGLEATYNLGETALQQTIGSGDAPVSIEVRGPDVDRLREISDGVAAQLAEMNAAGRGIYNVRTSFQGGREELAIHIDRLTAASLGLDVTTITRLVKRKLYGEEISIFRAEDEDRDIAIRHPMMNLDQLLNLEIENPTGTRILLKDIARVESETGPREILRRGQSRVALVQADLAEGVTLSEVSGDIGSRLDGMNVPRGYRFLVGGEEQRRQESFDKLRFAMLLALFLVYMVMASQFESLVHPFTIMLTIPMAGVGVAAFFFIAGLPLSVMAFIGIIILAGIAVNDGIILVDFVNILRRRGMKRREALLAAGQARLRPILMTSSTTILALLPLSLGFGEGAELRAPLAYAIIGGLITSTILTLLVLPVAYDLIDRLRPSGRGKDA